MKVNEILNKYFIYALYAFLAFTVFVNIRSCGTVKENRKLRKSVDAFAVELDSLREHTYSKDELDIRMEIHGLETSKRMLYDQNSVVRTVLRPDDRMNEYDQKIDELRKELEVIENVTDQ